MANGASTAATATTLAAAAAAVASPRASLFVREPKRHSVRKSVVKGLKAAAHGDATAGAHDAAAATPQQQQHQHQQRARLLSTTGSGVKVWDVVRKGVRIPHNPEISKVSDKVRHIIQYEYLFAVYVSLSILCVRDEDARCVSRTLRTPPEDRGENDILSSPFFFAAPS